VARLMGATTATRVGDGADCLFFGGNAGGGLLSTTRMPGKGGLGGATSSSVESGRSSADWDRPVVLFRISISRSVRGSSDWPSGLQAGELGFTGLVGDGCPCFSMVSLTSS